MPLPMPRQASSARDSQWLAKDPAKAGAQSAREHSIAA
jgi:hypothetical protein